MTRILICLALMACSSTEPRPSNETASPLVAADSTWIYRSDGSKQCEADTAVPLAAMKAELVARGITPLAEEKRRLPLAVTTVCGASTGMVNAFRIEPTDLSRATAEHPAGPPFALWDFPDEP